MPERTERIELPLLVQAAPLGSVDEEARTVEVVFTTGQVIPHLMRTDEGWRRVPTQVEVSEQAADLGRLNAGAAVLNSHSQWDARSVIGHVQRAWIAGGEGRAVLQFSTAEDVEPIWQRIRDGSLRACSMGFAVREVTIQKGEDGGELWKFTRWEPHEISMVAVGADAGAMVQSGEAGLHAAEVRRINQEGHVMPNDTTPAPAPAQTLTQAPPAPPAQSPDEIRAGERARIAGIRQTAATLGADESMITQAIDGNVSLDEFRRQAIDAYAARGQSETADLGRPRGEVTADATERFVQGAQLGLMARAGMTGGERNEFTAQSLTELARQSIALRDPRATFTDRRQMIAHAFVMQGAHSTSDFASILANVAHKAALAGWEEAAETFQMWTRAGTLTDFKPSKRVGLGLFSDLAEVPEGAEYTYGTVGDRAETITLATYGKLFRITRQAVINDDLSMLNAVPRKAGRAAKRTIGNLVYAILTGNPVMSDSVELFHADHGNLAGSAGAPSVTTFGAGRAAMRTQAETDGGAALNIAPRFVLAPASLETAISQLLKSTVDPTASKGHASNPVAGMAELVVEGRLDAASTTAWFLAADPNMHDTIEVAYLDGVQEPYLEEKTSWSSDGVELKVRIDAGVAPLDYRTLYKNAG